MLYVTAMRRLPRRCVTKRSSSTLAMSNFLCLGARAQMVLRKFDVAKQLLNDAVRQFPEFPMAHDTLGDLLLAQGYATEAVNAWEQVLRLDPTLVHVLPKIEKAESIRAAGNQPDVASDGSQSRGRRLAFAEEIRDAERQIESGESEPAEQALRAILKRDPNHVEGARLLARIAADKKAYRDAEIMLKHAAQNAPDYARVWVDLVCRVARAIQVRRGARELAARAGTRS